MSKILIAEEFFDSPNIGVSYTTEYQYCRKDVAKKAIEFAKLHVQAALEAAYKNAHRYYDPAEGEYDVDRDSIITAYPLENIK